MKNASRLVMLACIILLNTCQMKHDVALDKEAINSMSESRAKAFNEGDAKRIASFFTEDAVLMAPGETPMIGPAAVEAYYQSIFDQYETKLNSYYNEVKVDGDLGYGRGTAEVTLIPKNGDTSLISVSKYLNILQRQPNGEWKTTHDIWNDSK